MFFLSLVAIKGYSDNLSSLPAFYRESVFLLTPGWHWPSSIGMKQERSIFSFSQIVVCYSKYNLRALAKAFARRTLSLDDRLL